MKIKRFLSLCISFVLFVNLQIIRGYDNLSDDIFLKLGNTINNMLYDGMLYNSEDCTVFCDDGIYEIKNNNKYKLSEHNGKFINVVGNDLFYIFNNSIYRQNMSYGEITDVYNIDATFLYVSDNKDFYYIKNGNIYMNESLILDIDDDIDSMLPIKNGYIFTTLNKSSLNLYDTDDNTIINISKNIKEWYQDDKYIVIKKISNNYVWNLEKYYTDRNVEICDYETLLGKLEYEEYSDDEEDKIMSFGSDYIWPIDMTSASVKISQQYGGSDNHKGIDISAPQGTPIYASNSGTVVVKMYNAASGSGFGGYGNVLVLKHSDGKFTLYGHCNTLNVNEGDNIQQGQLIATVGSTGQSTGNHLHFEVKTSKKFGQINPNNYLDGNVTDVSGNNPKGYFDSVSAGPGYIHVAGWAFDADDTSQALSVHVYIGGPAGEGEGHIITADVTRTDVNKVYGCGDNHGFEATIPTDKTGSQSVYIYAINIGEGNDNTLLTDSPKTTTISKKLVHTVAYNANGGSGAPDSQTKRSGVQMNLSTTKPTRYCYNFVKWNTKADGSGTSYNPGANYTPDQDGGTVTLYAVWTPYKHTVAYNANGGSGAPDSQTKIADVQLNLSTTKPTRTGYTFVKWNTKADGSGTSYNSGANYTPDQDGGTVTLYAVWEINKYTISYNANGGSGAPSAQTKTYGTTLTLSSTKPTRSNYNFLGWATSSSATSATYSAGGSYTANSAATLYAVWSPYKHTVAYNANGGSGAPSSQTKTYGVKMLLSSTKPTRTGYTFLGWATTSTGTATYQPGDNYAPDQNGGTVTLYAVWEINKYTISYNANGGSGAPSAQTKNYGTTLTLSSTKPTKTGYDFLGWATSANATSATYSAGGNYTANSATTLYAVWKLKTYTISYNTNGGSSSIANQTKVYGKDISLSSEVPTKYGYQFVCWFNTSDDDSATYNSGDTYSDNADAIMKAVWKKILIGDVNNDKVVDEVDATLIMRHIFNAEVLDSSKYNSDAADCDGDGTITLLDAIWILNNKTN